MRRAARRDGNEPEIVAALRAAGASVSALNGDGIPDLLVGYRGETFLLEVKLPVGARGGARNGGGRSRPHRGGDGLKTEDQIRWWATWTGKPPVIVRTPEEALRAIGALNT